MGSGSCVDVMSINVGSREYRRCGGTTDVGRKRRKGLKEVEGKGAGEGREEKDKEEKKRKKKKSSTEKQR